MAVRHISGKEGCRQNFPVRHKGQFSPTLARQRFGLGMRLQHIAGIGAVKIGGFACPLFQKARATLGVKGHRLARGVGKTGRFAGV